MTEARSSQSSLYIGYTALECRPFSLDSMADRPLSPLRSALPVHVDPLNHPDPHAGSLQSKPARTNPRPRSRKGCLKCRDRKVKCDEEKPTCG
ncbi:similar to transcription factor Cys6 [Botrytis cinerea T4]|uniref:Similar to transcription factor Cys6 n=1 Tax=Botryotinia fuckeliana (strain T4) TaxID=999810 RepID=G2XNC7_BOTF4|nr:similar to transcription factor Cys6 [Botrytis cinerea T4]